jgi:hypothetical protein
MRRIAGGGSVDPQYSTELLVSSRKTTTYPPETVCRAGLRGWVLGRLGLRPDGLRPGKWFTSFFCFFSFLYFLFSVLLFLIQVCYFILQYLEFEIS